MSIKKIHNPNPYTAWRKAVLLRDNYACTACGSKEKLECDHIKPRKDYPCLEYDISNGRVLCASCHKKTSTYGGKLLKGTRRNNNPYGGYHA